MRTVEFRPLRRIKKTGLITVASYMQWRKVKTADYNNFSLIVDDEYKTLPSDEFVYNHKGEILYFFNYNPADVPVFDTAIFSLAEIREKTPYYGLRWQSGNVSYIMPGMDCDGVPTFSHWPEDRVTSDDVWNYYGPDQFKPLTVKTVVQWFGWFLWQLNNSSLKIGK